MTALAIDIGGTKFAAALVRPDGTMARRAETAGRPGPRGDAGLAGPAIAGTGHGPVPPVPGDRRTWGT